jgi:hypothetical protein
MIDDASVKVVSGLRPKIRNVKKQNDPNLAKPLLQKQQNTVQVCANPLDRLCELLLDWRILDDVGRKLDFRSEVTAFPNLQNSFPCYQEYLSSWEPLLIDEMKANILTNLPMSTKRQSKRGTAMVSTQGASKTDALLINLNCSFTENTAKDDGFNSSKAESSSRYVPA